VELYRPGEAEATFRDRWPEHFGPVFSRRGRPSPDFDPLARVPILKHNFSVEEVFSGDFLPQVRRWCRPIAARYLEGHSRGYAAMHKAIDEAGEAMGSELYKQAQRHVVDAPIEARKFHAKVPALENQGKARPGLQPVAPPGGFEKHLKRDAEFGGADAAKVLPE